MLKLWTPGESSSAIITRVKMLFRVVGLINSNSVLKYEMTLSNIQEVTARSGRVIAIAIEGDQHIAQVIKNDPSDNSEARVIYIPASHELLLPILEVVPLQLLAYHIAVRRGCDVDQPRNLAKSVTVE